MKEIQLPEDDGSLEAQLLDLYRGQRLLLEHIGTSEPSEIIALIEGLQDQLVALYGAQDRAGSRLPVFEVSKQT